MLKKVIQPYLAKASSGRARPDNAGGLPAVALAK
jgi:hypothetical protein